MAWIPTALLDELTRPPKRAWTCPRCLHAQCVEIREHDRYFETSNVDAHCAACHARLDVRVTVNAIFSVAEVGTV